MADRRNEQNNPDEQRSTPAYDDFIYDDFSDRNDHYPRFTFPEERGAAQPENDVNHDAPDYTDAPESNDADDSAFADEEMQIDIVERMRKRRGASTSRIRMDEAEEEKKGISGKLRKVLLTVVTIVLTLFIASAVVLQLTNISIFEVPELLVARVITPLQSAFSTATEGVAGYLRTLKLRANLEEEYNKLRAENEQLVYEAMLAEELQIQLSQFEDLADEVALNENMKPIICTVIDKAEGNYFASFTINKGSRDGIENYMAVTLSGALVGYTENVTETKSNVRCIIDSEASIAGIIQSSRNQGTVRGTLGVDGTAMCRMYYLSDDSLPRPGDIVVTSGVGMSFPKGIPIGTVRESTRGMESNKQYIVVEPQVDFEHIEYVIVLRYKPAAEAVTGRSNAVSDMEFVPLETARPYPTLRIAAESMFGTATPAASAETPSPTPTFSPTPTPSPTPTATPTATIQVPVYVYNPVFTGEPTATPTASPTPSPSPTPFITLNPSDMTYEED